MRSSQVEKRSSLRQSLKEHEKDALAAADEPTEKPGTDGPKRGSARMSAVGPLKGMHPKAAPTPEEQAEEVKAHRIRMQEAANNIQESINGLYQKKAALPKQKGVKTNQRKAIVSQEMSRMSFEAQRGDVSAVQAELDARRREREAEKAGILPGQLISQRASSTGLQEPLRKMSGSNESPTKQDEDEDMSPGEEGEEDDDDEEGDDDAVSDDEAMLSEDSDAENFDIAASKEKVQTLLENLNVEERVEVMDFLNSWFSEKSNRVHYDTETLRRIEEERSRDYVEAENASGTVSDKLETLEDKTISLVRQMCQAVGKVPIKPKLGRQRPKTGVSEKEYDQLTAFNPESEQNVQLEIAIQGLRTKLTEKEGEMRRAVQAAGGEDPGQIQMETDELMASLNKQGDEIADLNRQVSHGENRVRILKQALDHISSGNVDSSLPDQEVAEVIRDMRSKVQKGKIQELIAKREQDYGEELKKPDEDELKNLEAECDQMKHKLSSMELDIARLKDPTTLDREIQEQMNAIKEGKTPNAGSILDEVAFAEIQPERAPEVKTKLHIELLKAQEEEDKLLSQLQHYKNLCSASEKTLKTMEDQRTLFLDSVTTARAVHWGSKPKGEDSISLKKMEFEGQLIDTSVHQLFTQDESEDFNVETIQKQNEVLVKLRQEEQRLESRLKELGDDNEKILKEIEADEAKRGTLQEELDDVKETYRKDAYGEDVTAELIAKVVELTNGNKERMAQIRMQRQKFCGFHVPELADKVAARKSTSEEETEIEDANDFDKRIQVVKQAIEDNERGAPLPVVDKDVLKRAMRAGEKPSEQQLAQMLAAQCSKDLRELLDVQAQNVKLAKEVAALEEQISKAREQNHAGVDSESLEMKQLSSRSARELRRKQRELNALRAQWQARDRVRLEKERNERDSFVEGEGEIDMGNYEYHGEDEVEAASDDQQDGEEDEEHDEEQGEEKSEEV